MRLVHVSSRSAQPPDSFQAYNYLSESGCSGESYDNGEDLNLSDGNGEFNDSISSFLCEPK